MNLLNLNRGNVMNIKIIKLKDFDKSWKEHDGFLPLGLAARLLNKHPTNIVRDLYRYDICKFYIETESSKPLMSHKDYVFLKKKMLKK